MSLDPVAAACVSIESYLRGTISAASCADVLLWIPNTHPMRWTEVLREGHPYMTDAVLDTANAIRSGNRDAAALRAFCGDLRDGAAAMAATGWYRTLYGGAV